MPVLAASGDPVIRIYAVLDHPIPLGLEDDPVDAITPQALADSTQVWASGRIYSVRDGQHRDEHIDPDKINELVLRLQSDGVFGDGRARFDSFGHDASYEVIEVQLPDRSLRLASWHDLFEESPQVVAADRGLESLNGRDRDAVLAAQSPEYRRFRRIWSDIRSTVESWVPPSGKPITR